MCVKVKQNDWPENVIESNKDVDDLMGLYEEKKWLFRGQKRFGSIIASIDRESLSFLNRKQKLELENKCITQFINAVKYSSDEVEKNLIAFDPSHKSMFIERRISILMLLQHFNCPTRLVDWTKDPAVALNFATTLNYGPFDDKDGEVWCFDYKAYNEVFGPAQWPKNPEVYDLNDEFDNRLPVLFSPEGPKGNWFLLQRLYDNFHRLEHQSGYFSICPKFGQDHSIAIQNLFQDNQYYRKFILPKEIKPRIRKYLRKMGIWHGSLFPDAAGVAHAFRNEIFGIDY
jgi:hypothetical protein